jgi:hypothetical protein
LIFDDGIFAWYQSIQFFVLMQLKSTSLSLLFLRMICSRIYIYDLLKFTIFDAQRYTRRLLLTLTILVIMAEHWYSKCINTFFRRNGSQLSWLCLLTSRLFNFYVLSDEPDGIDSILEYLEPTLLSLIAETSRLHWLFINFKICSII